MHVMLGVSLRARWDATLVFLNNLLHGAESWKMTQGYATWAQFDHDTTMDFHDCNDMVKARHVNL